MSRKKSKKKNKKRKKQTPEMQERARARRRATRAGQQLAASAASPSRRRKRGRRRMTANGATKLVMVPVPEEQYDNPPRTHREALMRFYARVAPDKMSSVDKIVEKFQHNYNAMYQVLERLYAGEILERPEEKEQEEAPPVDAGTATRRWTGAISKIKLGVRLAAPTALGGLARGASARSLISSNSRRGSTASVHRSVKRAATGRRASVSAGVVPMLSAGRQRQRRGSTASARSGASGPRASSLKKKRQLRRGSVVAPLTTDRPSLRRVKTGGGGGGSRRGSSMKRVATVRMSETEASELRASLSDHLKSMSNRRRIHDSL